jgi:hypothetical protein
MQNILYLKQKNSTNIFYTLREKSAERQIFLKMLLDVIRLSIGIDKNILYGII